MEKDAENKDVIEEYEKTFINPETQEVEKAKFTRVNGLTIQEVIKLSFTRIDVTNKGTVYDCRFCNKAWGDLEFMNKWPEYPNHIEKCPKCKSELKTKETLNIASQ